MQAHARVCEENKLEEKKTTVKDAYWKISRLEVRVWRII